MIPDSPVGATACEHAFCAKYPHLAANRHELEAENFGSIDELRERLSATEEQAEMCHEFCRGADQRTAEARADAAALREQLAEAQRAGEAMVTPEVLQSVKDRLYGEIHGLRQQLAAAEVLALAERAELQRRLDAALTPFDPATAHALAAVRTERDELRGLVQRLVVAAEQGFGHLGGRGKGCDGCEAIEDARAFLAPTEPDGASAAIPEGTPGGTTP